MNGSLNRFVNTSLISFMRGYGKSQFQAPMPNDPSANFLSASPYPRVREPPPPVPMMGFFQPTLRNVRTIRITSGVGPLMNMNSALLDRTLFTMADASVIPPVE